MARVALMLENGGMLTQEEVDNFKAVELAGITSRVFKSSTQNDLFYIEKHFLRGNQIWALVFALNVADPSTKISALDKEVRALGLGLVAKLID